MKMQNHAEPCKFVQQSAKWIFGLLVVVTFAAFGVWSNSRSVCEVYDSCYRPFPQVACFDSYAGYAIDFGMIYYGACTHRMEDAVLVSEGRRTLRFMPW